MFICPIHFKSVILHPDCKEASSLVQRTTNKKDTDFNMNSQIKILLLLVITFTAIFFYARSPIGITFAQQLLRKADLNVFLPQEEDTTSVMVVEEKLEPDSTAQRFLFVGDSMVEPLAYRFYDICKESGDTMYAVTWYGSTTTAWSGETFDYFLDEASPTFVIFCVGSNELYSKNLSTIHENLLKMKEKAGDRPCVFIGPPNTTPDEGLNDEIAKVFGKKGYFDSRGIEMERRNDHLHPTNKGAVTWMDEVALWLNSDSCLHPVVLQKPQGPQSYKIEHIEVMQVKDKGRKLNRKVQKAA